MCWYANAYDPLGRPVTVATLTRTICPADAYVSASQHVRTKNVTRTRHVHNMYAVRTCHMRKKYILPHNYHNSPCTQMSTSFRRPPSPLHRPILLHRNTSGRHMESMPHGCPLHPFRPILIPPQRPTTRGEREHQRTLLNRKPCPAGETRLGKVPTVKRSQGTWWILGASAAIEKKSCTLHTKAQNHNITTIGDSLLSPNKQRSRKMGTRFSRDRSAFGTFQKWNHRRRSIQLAS